MQVRSLDQEDPLKEGGHGNPLQYSCLEKPMDRGACWATIGLQRVTQDWSNLVAAVTTLNVHALNERTSKLIKQMLMEWKEGIDKSTLNKLETSNKFTLSSPNNGVWSRNFFKIYPLFLKITYREDADTLAWFPHFCPESVGMVKSYLDFYTKVYCRCP